MILDSFQGTIARLFFTGEVKWNFKKFGMKIHSIFLFVTETKPQDWANRPPLDSYLCPECNAGFRRMFDLLRHKCGVALRFACPYCHKKDKSSSNVYRHVRRWHSDLPLVIKKMF